MRDCWIMRFRKCLLTGVITLLSLLLLQIFLYWKFTDIKLFLRPWKLSPLPHKQINVAMRRLPQALIIGVKKCGTGTLGTFLKLNPHIARKGGEIHFFDKHFEKGYGWYINQMIPSTIDQISIECSPRYFVYPKADERIHNMNSSVKLIVIVRDPTTRLISDYLHEKVYAAMRGKRYPTFKDAVFNENGTINASYEPVSTGMYAMHLQRWLSLFSKEQILIVDGDNFRNNPWEELNRVEKFLKLTPVITEENFIFNEARGFYCLNESGVPHCMNPMKGRKHPRTSPDHIQTIRKFYEHHNEGFIKMTGLNFNWNQDK